MTASKYEIHAGKPTDYKTAQHSAILKDTYFGDAVLIVDLWRTFCEVCDEITAFFWIDKGEGLHYYECKECKSLKSYYVMPPV